MVAVLHAEGFCWLHAGDAVGMFVNCTHFQAEEEICSGIDFNTFRSCVLCVFTPVSVEH